jgi:hypothetical protein
MWFGVTSSDYSLSNFKTILEHELGHAVQRMLMGQPTVGDVGQEYRIDTTAPSCRCDNVVTSNKLHCLQSRHEVWAAQNEGWGSFFAATNLNTNVDNNCTFAYYKEFRNDDGTVTSPPMAKSCFNQTRWMETHCNSSTRGTEWDWMNFYWRLNNKDGYSFADFTSVYTMACAGSCDGKPVTWPPLNFSAGSVFGVGSAKAVAWTNQGTNFGVAH